MALAMEILFRTTDGVEGSTTQAPSPQNTSRRSRVRRHEVLAVCSRNAAAFDSLLLTALGISLASTLVTLFVTSPSGELETYAPVEEAAAAL